MPTGPRGTPLTDIVRIMVGYNQNFAIAGTDTPMGTCRFYFGTKDQAVDSIYAAALTDPTLASAFRGLCYAVFDDCYIGPNNNVSSISIVLGRRPTYGFSALETLNTYDYNPAHAIYHIIEGEDRLLGLIDYCDDTTFAAVASTLSGEDRGISILMNKMMTAKAWIEFILKHVRGMMRSSSDE